MRLHPFTSNPSLLTTFLLPLAWLASGSTPLLAKLPSLNRTPWLGFFVGHSGSRGTFGIADDGSLHYNHHSDGGSVSSGYSHHIHPAVAETMPDGSVRIRRLIPDSLKTENSASDKPSSVTFHGEVAGGTTIEVNLTFTRRDVSIGGRIMHSKPGGNPLQFCLYTQAPAYYLSYNESETIKNGTAEQKEKLAKKTERQKNIAAKESLILRRLNGKQLSLPLLDDINLSDTAFNGEGFASIETNLSCLKDRKIEITATEGSRMKLSNKVPRPIFKYHYNITWTQDPAAKSHDKGRMVFTTR